MRPVKLAVLLIAVGGIATMTAAARADSIAVLPLEIGVRSGVSREDLHEAVLKGLAVAGRPVVALEDPEVTAMPTGEKPPCASPACWAELGRRVGAAYVVGGAVARTNTAFRVSLRLVRTSNGTTLAREENQCDVGDCSLAELVRLSARELVRQTLGRKMEEAPVAAPAARAVAAARVATPPAPIEPVAAVKVAASSIDARPRTDTRRVAGWVMTAAGAFGVAAGVFLLARDGDCSGSGCYRVYDTKMMGWTFVGAGAIASTIGGWLVYRSSSAVTVGAAPGTLWLAGHF